MYFLLNMGIFHGYVSLPEGNGFGPLYLQVVGASICFDYHEDATYVQSLVEVRSHASQMGPRVTVVTIWVFPKIGVPQNGWFIMENLGGTIILGNIHIVITSLIQVYRGYNPSCPFIRLLNRGKKNSM